VTPRETLERAANAGGIGVFGWGVLDCGKLASAIRAMLEENERLRTDKESLRVRLVRMNALASKRLFEIDAARVYKREAVEHWENLKRAETRIEAAIEAAQEENERLRTAIDATEPHQKRLMQRISQLEARIEVALALHYNAFDVSHTVAYDDATCACGSEWTKNGCQSSTVKALLGEENSDG
jgi:regulator of replication initiation timing